MVSIMYSTRGMIAGGLQAVAGHWMIRRSAGDRRSRGDSHHHYTTPNQAYNEFARTYHHKQELAGMRHLTKRQIRTLHQLVGSHSTLPMHCANSMHHTV
jgi:hypothetical protein